VAVVAVAAVVAALLGAHGSAVRAQPVASIALPEPGASVQLYPGCNNIGLTFPDGTASETVVQAVTPAGVVQAMWRHNAALNKFEGFSPAAPQASDLLTVNFLDAVWLCVAGAPPPVPTATSPAAPTAPAPMATPTPPTATSGAPIVFESGDGKEQRFYVDTSRFRVDWTARVSELEEVGGLMMGSFVVSFLPLDPPGDPRLCIFLEGWDYIGVNSGTWECDAGPGEVKFEVTGTGVEWWRLEITALPD